MNYKEMLHVIEYKIEMLLRDITENNPYTSPRTEERLTALCLGREYLKEKMTKNTEV